MKWLIAIITTVILGGCVSSSSVAVPSEISSSSNKTVESLETQTLKVFSVKELQRQERLENNKQKIKQVVKKLLNRVGKTRYVFSGSTPYGWDCSGMVKWGYGQIGKELPHSATKQAYAGRRVAQKDRKVGDIVIFGYKGYKSFYHSAIYIGKGKIVNANRGFGGTYIQHITDFKDNRVVYVRVLETP